MKVRVIDSHTEGEPTRVVVSGGPELKGKSLKEKLENFREQFDDFRSGVVCEPRGSDVIVGALLIEPSNAEAACGVIFFNNTGYLGMCGHGTIGLVRTLAHLGQIERGDSIIETPVGDVKATLNGDSSVTVENVLSYRFEKSVELSVPGYGKVVGDVAYGGNWFFLAHSDRVAVTAQNLNELTHFATAIRDTLEREGIAGENGAEIDHIELFGQQTRSDADSKNFVLCPGLAYDRSPCGTGTSAKLACLFADGKLKEGQVYRQESIIGSLFSGSVRPVEGGIIPSITGSAWIAGDSNLFFDQSDPFRSGIRLQ